MFFSGVFHLILSDWGWLQVTEAEERETADKGVLCSVFLIYLHITLHIPIHFPSSIHLKWDVKDNHSRWEKTKQKTTIVPPYPFWRLIRILSIFQTVYKWLWFSVWILGYRCSLCSSFIHWVPPCESMKLAIVGLLGYWHWPLSSHLCQTNKTTTHSWMWVNVRGWDNSSFGVLSLKKWLSSGTCGERCRGWWACCLSQWHDGFNLGISWMCHLQLHSVSPSGYLSVIIQ